MTGYTEVSTGRYIASGWPTTRYSAPTKDTSKNDILFAMALIGSTYIEVTGHQSDLGRWRTAQRPAEPRLRDYVLGYFASESFVPRPLHERHLPLREVAIVLNFAAPHRIIDPSDPKQFACDNNVWVRLRTAKEETNENPY